MYQCRSPGGSVSGPRGRTPRRRRVGSRRPTSGSRSSASAPRPCMSTSAPAGVLAASRRVDVIGLRCTRRVERYSPFPFRLQVALGLAVMLDLVVALALAVFFPLGRGRLLERRLAAGESAASPAEERWP